MKSRLIFRFIEVAILLGALFVFIGWSLAIYSANLPWTLDSISAIHEMSVVIYVLDTVPVLLCLTLFMFLSAIPEKSEHSNHSSQASTLKLILETMADGFVTISDEGTILSVNAAVENMFGYSEKELVGECLHFLMPDSFNSRRDVVLKHLQNNRLKDLKGIAGQELQGKKKDGTILYLSATFSEMLLEGECKFNVVLCDITDIKQAQAAALRTADELTQFVDTANAPIFGIDFNGLVNEWNQSAEQITGYAKSEVYGKDLVAEFITEEYKAPVKRVLDSALLGVESASYEFPLYTKTDQRVDVLLNATTRRDVDGLIIGVIGVGQDITELRQKQNALNQAGKMESVGQLTGGIAHDFNNLLSIIDGNLRFLQQDIGVVSQEVEELFEDAMSATADGAELTARLLAFSRNRILKPELSEVNEFVHNFSRFLSRTLGNTADLQTKLAKRNLYINIDSSQLENALLNLSINARDAMVDGGDITISVKPYHHSNFADNESNYDQELILESGDYVVVSVEDTGVGIESDDLARVYEPFFTTKEVGKGTGLGLSMVYGFIQQSNGQCVIRSKVGEGTRVSMYFPEAKNMGQEKSNSKNNEIEFAGSEVILVVEDEPRVRRVALRDLKRLGYRTLEANSAAMAKNIIDSGKKIDLIFSDVLMPGEVDGQMLGRWVEKNYPMIKVVLTSGFTKRETDVDKYVSSFPLLRKPYTIDALAKQIRARLFEN